MKEDILWKLIAGIGLITLSLILLTAHFLIFKDAHYLFQVLLMNLALIPINVIVVTLIIHHLLESRDKQQRMEKLNMVIGTFFSNVGTPLLVQLTQADSAIGNVKGRLVIGDHWRNEMFRDVQACLKDYTCSVDIGNVDPEALRIFLLRHEDFLVRLVENPMIFEHGTFTDLIFAINHLTEEMKARGDLSVLPPSDLAHLTKDIHRAYSQLITEWLKYMEYLKNHYPYLFNLAMRKNPFDDLASVIIRQTP